MNILLSKSTEEKLEKLSAAKKLPKEKLVQEILRKYVHSTQFDQLQKSTFAKATNLGMEEKKSRKEAFGKYRNIWVAPDFNAPLDDLKDYME